MGQQHRLELRTHPASPWPRIDPHAVYGPPDLVLPFLTAAQGKEARKAWRAKAQQEALRGWPPAPPGMAGAALKRYQAKLKSLVERWKRKYPLIGLELIDKKNQIEPLRRGKRAAVGHTPLWRAFEAWAVARLQRDILPIVDPVHVCWRYTPPSTEHAHDEAGVHQTVVDLLQAAAILLDDNLVEHGSESRILAPDPEAPRLEVWVRLS